MNWSTWYITSWKSTGKVNAASSSSFKLQWTRVSSWQHNGIGKCEKRNTVTVILSSVFHSPDPGREKTLEYCASSKVALVCVLTALPSEEARAWWRSTCQDRKQKDFQAWIYQTNIHFKSIDLTKYGDYVKKNTHKATLTSPSSGECLSLHVFM